MKYSYEFKLECVKNYKEGKPRVKPEWCKLNNHGFITAIETWVRLFDLYGPDGLKHKQFNKNWTKEERYGLVAKVLAGQSNKSVAIEAGINEGQLYQWVKKYKQYGIDGLELKHKGRPPKGGYIMTKSKRKPEKLTRSEKEELILLRERERYLEAENAYLKKITALTVKKKAESSAKAKKQPSSKDS